MAAELDATLAEADSCVLDAAYLGVDWLILDGFCMIFYVEDLWGFEVWDTATNSAWSAATFCIKG